MIEMDFAEILIGLVIVFYAVYYYLTRNFDYWEKRDVAGPKPRALYGNFKDITLLSYYDALYLKSIYEAYPKEPAVGLFKRSAPLLMLRDPDLIKDAMIKSFPNFRDRGDRVHKKIAPLQQNLFFVPHTTWKPLRRKISPTFSSGKLKEMFYLMSDCIETFMDYMTEAVSKGKTIDCNELNSSYTIDVIGVCAFGLNMDSTNEDSEFRKMGHRIFDRSRMNAVRRIVNNSFHWLGTLLGPLIVDRPLTNFFLMSVKETMRYRKESGVRRNDFIDLLLDIKNDPKNLEEDVELTDTLLAAQAFVFFAAGYETSSKTMSNAMYELAMHPDIQDKLRKEVDVAFKESNGKLTYDDIKKMKYLDKIFKETLRKYPPVHSLTRMATTDHTFDKNNLSINKGTPVLIPVYSIHHDPKIYPNPEKFDPERFEEKLVQSRPSCTFLPFGDGPHNCIGMRFGYYQTKLGIAYATKNFEFQVCDETPKTYELGRAGHLIVPKKPLYLKFKKLA